MSAENAKPLPPAAELSSVAVLLPDMIGTSICAMPAVEAIGAAFPAARLQLLGFARAAELLRDEPVARHLELLELGELVGELAKRLGGDQRPELVFDFLSTPQSEGALARAGIPHRVGWPTGEVQPGHTIAVPPPGAREQMANQDYLDFLLAVGQPAALQAPRLRAAPETLAAAQAWLTEHGASDGPLCVLGVGGGNELKRWPLAHYAQIADQLRQRVSAQLVFFLGPQEAGQAPALRRAHPDALVAESLPLDLAKGIIALARVAVCNDHAIMHLAAALGVPTIGVFLASNPAEWFPYGLPAAHVIGPPLDCRPCYAETCEDWECNHPALLAEVTSLVDQLLESSLGAPTAR